MHRLLELARTLYVRLRIRIAERTLAPDTFRDGLNERGQLIIPERYIVEYPLYIAELERFWVRFGDELTHIHFECAVAGMDCAHVIEPFGPYADATHVIEFFFPWGTVFVVFSQDD